MGNEYSLDGMTLKQRIIAMPEDRILFRSDFPEYHTEFVGSILSELTTEGILVKITQGIYVKSRNKSRKTKSDGREKRKAIFEAKTKCAQKSRLLPPSGQNTSVVQTPFESCLKDAFLLNFLLKYHLKTHCQFSKKSYLYIVVMLPLCIPSRPHS